MQRSVYKMMHMLSLMKVMTAGHIYLVSTTIRQKPTSQRKLTISLAWSFSFATDPYAFCFPSLIAWLHHIQLEQWRWGSRVFPRKFLVTSLQDSDIRCTLLQSRIDHEIPVQLHMEFALFGFQWPWLQCTHESLIKISPKWEKSRRNIVLFFKRFSSYTLRLTSSN